MSFRDPFSTLYETMLYFHKGHHQYLISMQQQCKKINNIKDLHRLASDIRGFCEGLHGHHTIEDRTLFPIIACKTDISHLEAHHTQLAKLLAELDNFAKRLKQIQTLEEDNNIVTEATSLIDQLSALVNEHERAEEKVIEPENMKKWFTATEMRDNFHI